MLALMRRGDPVSKGRRGQLLSGEAAPPVSADLWRSSAVGGRRRVEGRHQVALTAGGMLLVTGVAAALAASRMPGGMRCRLMRRLHVRRRGARRTGRVLRSCVGVAAAMAAACRLVMLDRRAPRMLVGRGRCVGDMPRVGLRVMRDRRGAGAVRSGMMDGAGVGLVARRLLVVGERLAPRLGLVGGGGLMVQARCRMMRQLPSRGRRVSDGGLPVLARTMLAGDGGFAVLGDVSPAG